MSGITSTKPITGLITLGPDLTRLGTQQTDNPYVAVTGIDATGSPTNILTLSGKFAVSLLRISGTTSENVTVTLTVDGVIIFNETFAVNTSGFIIYGNTSDDGGFGDAPFEVKGSLTLDIETATDTNITFTYIVRPIV